MPLIQNGADISLTGLRSRSMNDIREELVKNANALSPGLTADLPASLIEDVVSTSVASIMAIEQARAEFLTNLTPVFSAKTVLPDQAAAYGVGRLLDSPASIYIVFYAYTNTFIPKGTLVAIQADRVYETQEDAFCTLPLTTEDGTIADDLDIPYNSTTQTGEVRKSNNVFCITQDRLNAPVAAPATPAGVYLTLKSSFDYIIYTAAPAKADKPKVLVTQPASGFSGVVGSEETIASWRYRIQQALQANMHGSSASILSYLFTNVGGLVPRLCAIVLNGANNAAISTRSYKIVLGGNYDRIEAAKGLVSFLGLTANWQDAAFRADRSQTLTPSVYGQTFSVTFVQPTEVKLELELSFRFINIRNPAQATLAAIIQQPVLNYVNSLRIGASLNSFQLSCEVKDAIEASKILSTSNISEFVIKATSHEKITPYVPYPDGTAYVASATGYLNNPQVELSATNLVLSPTDKYDTGVIPNASIVNRPSTEKYFTLHANNLTIVIST